MYPGIWTGIHHTLPLDEALRRLHLEGWSAFEIATEHLETLEAAADPDTLMERTLRVARALDLRLPQAHALLSADVAAVDPAARARDLRRLKAHFELAARLGAEVVVVHPGGGRGITREAEWRRIEAANVEAFRELGDHAARLGLRIGIENMIRRGLSSPREMTALLDAIAHPAVAFTFDTSHAHASGFSLADYTREMGSRLVALHVSDNNGSGDQHLVPGSGTADWNGFREALREIRYHGFVNLEIPGERHADPGLQRLKLRHALAVARWLAE